MKSADFKRKVFVVDDNPTILSHIMLLLKDIYEVKLFKSGLDMLDYVKRTLNALPDLILLDVVMPDCSGYDIIKELKNDDILSEIPVIFLTARNDEQDETMGLELGAVDYITKPFQQSVLLARIQNHLFMKDAKDFLKSQSKFLEAEVERRVQEIKKVQELVIYMTTSLTETRDNETGNHIKRTQEYTKLLAQKLKTHEKFRHLLDDKMIEMIHQAAPLHDLGKIGIPDCILLKPGRLTPEEFDVIKKHTILGKQVVERAEKMAGMSFEFMTVVKDIVYSHHEKWDGSGYPEGLKGDEIPLAARLMALADVFDALSTKRVYKDAYPIDVVIEEILKGKGTHFDPDVVDAFLSIKESFISICRSFSD